MANIAEMDRINTKVDKIEKIHNELKKLVVESIYEFCCEIFQELLRTRLKIDLDWFLWRRHCDQEAPTLTQEYLADKYKTWIEYLDDTSEYYRFRENLHRYLTIRHSIFDPIYRSICEYESYIGNKYFSNDISALKKSYVSCLKYTYDDLLDECMHAFVSIMLPIVKCTESRKQYMDLFHFACTEMLQDCEENKILILGCADIENHLKRLYKREAFNSKLELYADGLYLEQVNLKLRKAM